LRTPDAPVRTPEVTEDFDLSSDVAARLVRVYSASVDSSEDVASGERSPAIRDEAFTSGVLVSGSSLIDDDDDLVKAGSNELTDHLNSADLSGNTPHTAGEEPCKLDDEPLSPPLVPDEVEALLREHGRPAAEAPWLQELSPTVFDGPTESLFQTTLPGCPLEVFRALYATTAIEQRCHTNAGDTDMNVTPWFRLPSDALVRRHTFKTRVGGGPIKAGHTRVEQIQQLQLTRDTLLVHTRSSMPDIPYGGYFSILFSLRLARHHGQSQVEVAAGVHFTKSTVWAKRIKSGALVGTAKSTEELLRLVRETLPSHPTAS